MGAGVGRWVRTTNLVYLLSLSFKKKRKNKTEERDREGLILCFTFRNRGGPYLNMTAWKQRANPGPPRGQSSHLYGA